MRIPALLFILFFTACARPSSQQAVGPVISTSEILGSYEHFMHYKMRYLKLSVPYTALDTAGREIGREQFLQQYASGEYLPVRMHAEDSSIRYQLYKLPASAENFRNVLHTFGNEEYGYFQKEGKKYPPLDFRDIHGKLYDSAATAGKTLVLKYWFIHCVACVKEMPRLNQIQAEYRDNKDVMFISFAFDTAEQLRAFIKKTAFNYAVVPVPESYMEGIGIKMYPTHMIVNKQGEIARVTGDAEELAAALEVELGK